MPFTVIRNPEVFIDREKSKVIHDDESWQFYAPADGCKLGDLQVWDDDGRIVPLDQRFDRRREDVRY